MLPDLNIGDIGDGIKSLGRGLKDGIVGVFQGEWEKKVSDVTSNDKEIQDSEVINDICSATNSRGNYDEIMNKVMDRLDQEPEDWKIIYKDLLLIDHILRKGSKRCVDDFRSNRRAFKRLFNFDYFDENQNDCGVNIREKSHMIYEMLDNDEALRDSRQEAKVSKNKYEGEGHSVNPGTSSSSSVISSIGSFFGISSSNKNSYGKKNRTSYYNEDGDDDEDDKYATKRTSHSLKTSSSSKSGSDVYGGPSPDSYFNNDPYSSSSSSSSSSYSSTPATSIPAPTPQQLKDPYFTPSVAPPTAAPTTAAPTTVAPNAFGAFGAFGGYAAAPNYNQPPPPAAAPALDPFAMLAANSNNGQTAAASSAFFSAAPAAPAPAAVPAPAAAPAFSWGAPAPAAQPVISNNFFSTAPAPTPVTQDFFSTVTTTPQPAQTAPTQPSFFSGFPQAQPAPQPAPVQQPAAPAVPAAFSFFLEQNSGASTPASSAPTTAAPALNTDSLFSTAPSSNTSSAASFDHLFDLSSLGGKKEEEKKGPAFSPSTAPPPNLYAAYKW